MRTEHIGIDDGGETSARTVRGMRTALRMHSNINSGSFKKQLLERGHQCNAQQKRFSADFKCLQQKWWYFKLAAFFFH